MMETEFCKVEYLKERNAIFLQWKKFCQGEHYRRAFEYGLQLINKHNAALWITDTTNGFENAPEDTQWLLETFIPRAIESPCTHIIFIIKEESLLKEEIKQQETVLSRYFKVQKVSTPEAVL